MIVIATNRSSIFRGSTLYQGDKTWLDLVSKIKATGRIQADLVNHQGGWSSALLKSWSTVPLLELQQPFLGVQAAYKADAIIKKTMTYIIHANALMPSGPIPDALVGISNGKIVNVEPYRQQKLAGEVIDASGLVISPGWIDIQINGDLDPILRMIRLPSGR